MDGREASPLLAPRKAVTLLREGPERLEAILRWCTEKDSARPLNGDLPSIRAIVARLGTLDRHHHLEAAKRIASGAPRPDLPGFAPADDPDAHDRELAELLTRFRHLRAQSVAFLEVVEPEGWDKAGVDPVLGELTLARIVSQWVENDASMMGRIESALRSR